MKREEIAVGGVYMAKVSNRIVPVRVDEINKVSVPKGMGRHSGIRYACTNTVTGRQISFRSATKFRRCVDGVAVVIGGKGKAPLEIPEPPTHKIIDTSAGMSFDIKGPMGLINVEHTADTFSIVGPEGQVYLSIDKDDFGDDWSQTYPRIP